jgi:hypothetical protein
MGLAAAPGAVAARLGIAPKGPIVLILLGIYQIRALDEVGSTGERTFFGRFEGKETRTRPIDYDYAAIGHSAPSFSMMFTCMPRIATRRWAATVPGYRRRRKSCACHYITAQAQA